MTQQPQEAWSVVADRIGALALKLKLHTEEELAQAGVSLSEIGDKLTAAISGAAEALEDACHDDAIREDLRSAGTAISDAIHTSLHGVKRSVRVDD